MKTGSNGQREVTGRKNKMMTTTANQKNGNMHRKGSGKSERGTMIERARKRRNTRLWVTVKRRSKTMVVILQTACGTNHQQTLKAVSVGIATMGNI